MNAGRSSARFSLSRVHPGEWLAGLCGIALIAGLLLPWSGGESAMASPGILDLLLLLIAVLAVLLPATVAASSRTNVPILFETSLWPVSLLLGILLLAKLLFPPDGGLESGFWISLASVVFMAFFLWRSVDREQ